MKMSNKNLFKKTFLNFFFSVCSKPSYALNKKCKNYIYLNNSKNKKEQLKEE